MPNNNHTTEQVSQTKVTAYSVAILVLCTLTWGASFISRNVWSSAIASESTLLSLGITAAQAGGLATAFYVGYVVSNFFSGWLIDAIGAKKSLALTALGTGFATWLISITNGYWIMFLLRVLAGLFAGPLFSSITKFNFAYFPDRLRGVITGVMGAGPMVGSAIASIAFTPMVASHGYKVAFIWAGVATLLIGVLDSFILKDKGVTLPIKSVLTEEEKKNATGNAVKVFMQRDFLIGSATHFFIMCASTGLMTWMLSYLVHEKGMAPITAGMVYGGAQFVGLVSGTIGGIISDVLKSRKWVMIIVCPITTLLLYLFTTLSTIATLSICFALIQLCQGIIGTCSNTMQAERAKGPYLGKVMGWYNGVCQLGSVVMPVVLGIILDTTNSYRLVILAIAFTFIAIMFLGFLVKDTYIRNEPIKA